ncbi:hypothetical protein [Paenibacillus antibioticophila]|uniref:hypothetical protein n=1 Tax=Paenibacillus antibioticophila TaxID=1274374 RepID=UPI0005C92404|nr:hypothetical protein [Paenibacillus antibioticophila]
MQSSEAFHAVCERISSKYTSNGWKYAKSRHWLIKKDKNLTYKIYFYTNWNNVSDRNVGFYGESAIILNKSKNKIFHINTHECNIPEGKLYWNVADQESWSRAIAEFTAWLDEVFMPIVHECTNNLENFIRQVVAEGFYPLGGYKIDIHFILLYGSRELAEEATKRLYESLEEPIKHEFKKNYESMIQGNDPVSAYGRNMMRNYSNFRTIIENKIIVNL